MARNVSRKSRNRRAVIWFVTGIVVWQLALAVAVDQWLPQVRDPEYAIKEKRLKEKMAEFPDRPIAVMLGSSRTAYGLNANLIGAQPNNREPILFNFGLPGGGPIMQRICYDRLRDAGIQPALILFEILPAFFNGESGERVELNMLDGARLNLEELQRVRSYSASANAPYRRWTYGRSLPSQRHQAELNQAIGLDIYRPEAKPSDPKDAIRSDGWWPQTDPYLRENVSDLTALAHRQYDPFYQDFSPNTGSTQMLKSLLHQCTKDGVKVALVLMPEASHFRRLESAKYQEGIAQFLKNLHEEFGVISIDARSWVPDNQSYDGHHLFPEGANTFSYRLQAELRSRQILLQP
jgi:hypothetical protein